MSDYIVSARKYRPDSFGTLIGQDGIARTLKNSILRGQLAHAYLFCGPRGVGKTSTARIFAKAINCSNPGSDMEPCGECESCRSFAEGRSYCIHELDAASNNGVEDIKALMDKVQIPPQVGRYSVYIIDEVHMLSQSAFNAFLKTLEEPPAHAIFILCTTEKHKIIPTILSRCQTYDFNRIGIADMVSTLRGIARAENVTIDDESLHVIAGKADGAMRDALTIFDQTVAFCGTEVRYDEVIRNLNVLDSEYSFRLVDAFLAGDYPTALLLLDEILAKGFNALHFVSSVGQHLRDLLVSGTGGLECLLDMPDSMKPRYAEQASRCTVKFIYDALDVISQCEAGYKAAVNQRLHMEFSLMKLCFLVAKPSSPVPREVPAAPVSTDKASPATAAAATVDVTPAVSGPSSPVATVETRQERPEPKARTAKRAASLSLSALMGGEEETAGEPAPRTVGNGIPSDEAVTAAWNKLPAIYPDKPRMASLLSNADIGLREEDGYKIVTLTVVNEAQRQWLQDPMYQRRMEGELRADTGSSAIRLEIEVKPEEEMEQKIYMPAEKAKDLMESNGEVKAFISDLGLDVK